MNYQWYPGHMMKAKRMMQENISLIDLVIELVDARIPLASRNPDIDELGKNKSRLVLLNKSDLADPAENRRWMAYFEEQGFHVLEINAKTGQGLKAIRPKVQEACKEKLERDRKRGIKNRPVRAIVVGIPNVGKSTFINSFAGKACTKTGNKPGVTKGKQWIRLNKELELLDTPGILWPKFESEEVGKRLAMIGSMNDEILQMTELAMELLDDLLLRYRQPLLARYQAEEGAEEITSVQMLRMICENRKCYKKGQEPDLEKAAALLLDDFRSGRIGRITLETCEEQ
ncbi:MAG: ribosome biogenesis GTPase YlqF [Bacteroidales bacterium]|nr:ribosome biogenesis GTPase YlqF [Bacteroidales bacterium]MCM1416425.1 ribosome biogenesis GTPase YlqF [bacterium]MCM1424044.1 ribosome biogenesis GTPase YlqF [bacterium]